MLHLHEKSYEYIRVVIETAIKYKFRYLVQYIYSDLTIKIESKQILDLYTLVRNANLLNNECVRNTIQSLIEQEKSIEEVINQLEILSDAKEISMLYSMIFQRARKEIVFGKWWKTFRQFFIKYTPPAYYVQLVIQECLYAQENEAFIKDVAVNLINKLTIGYSLTPELRDILPLFFKLQDRITEVSRKGTSVNVQVEQDYSPFSVNVESRSITSIKKSEQYVSQHRTSHTFDTREPPIFDPPSNLSTLESPVYSVGSTLQLNVYEGDRSNIPSNESAQIECDTTIKSPYVTDVPWVMHIIENLPEPSSPHQHRFWKFNIDLISLREGIQHKDYKHVLQILDKYSKYENNIFLKGCYNILRNNIMSSDEHLVNIIKISVQTGMSSILEETLFTLGRYVLIELADNGSWVLAYKLLKTLKIYESRFNVGFILLSAEIYIANDRPLKALEILRRELYIYPKHNDAQLAPSRQKIFFILKKTFITETNVIFTNRKKWKIPSESRDEDLRVIIISLLLESLCGNFVESAFALYDTLLGDQYCIYFPIDLPHYIDKLTLALLTTEKYDLLIELARLLIPYNFMLRPNIFRAVIVTATTRDIILANQLFQYGAKLGTYQAIKLNTPVFLIINTRWMEEEIYLTVTELIQQLFMEIGHAIDRMRVRQLAVYVSFETIPSSRELQLSEVRKYDNKHNINSTRQVMENILKKRFDPPLGFVQTHKGKFAKFSSEKLINYMKSTHVAL
ncbi:uncharacterized protein LOC107268262 isoform X2 [Cephus cinctus]|uniref:Uncharacterized protein LOC107268262 isoform X2 n=1 Tax=Cephus cinctus TaxID=211228 RepID=A0AAJ7FKK8_CEPCN|nr:uncharacterized protein LOC107268262 isoform X2 [Cephus cinctus]